MFYLEARKGVLPVGGTSQRPINFIKKGSKYKSVIVPTEKYMLKITLDRNGKRARDLFDIL